MPVGHQQETDSDEDEDDAGNQKEKVRATLVLDVASSGTHLMSKPVPDRKATTDDTERAESEQRAEAVHLPSM